MGYLTDKGLNRVWEKVSDLNDWMPKGAGAHNSIYRGKDITYKLTDRSLWDSISSGTFDDVFVGDYITVNLHTIEGYANDSYTVSTRLSSSTVSTILRVVDIDRDYGKGSSGNKQTQHHIVMLPDTSLGTSMYGVNSSANVSGGYVLSEMHTVVMPAIATELATVFNDHLLTQKTYLVNQTYAADSGLASVMGAKGATWTTCKACLLSEVEVYGHPALTSLGTNKYRYEIGKDYSQLQAFKLNPKLICTSQTWWLRSYVWMNDTGYVSIADVDETGVASAATHSNSKYLRPKFLLG